VRLTDADIDAMAVLLEMDIHAFTETYTRVTRDRAALALTDHADGSCIFLQGGTCKVQDAKPQQCREFPDVWHYRDMSAVCPAEKGLKKR
jgi:Fe-S-cluster containining protein